MSFWECEKCGGVPGVTNCCTDKAMTQTHTKAECAEVVDPWVIIDKLRAQHRAEIHETWTPLVAALREQLEAARRAPAVPVPVTDADIRKMRAMVESGQAEEDDLLALFDRLTPPAPVRIAAAPQPPEAAPAFACNVGGHPPVTPEMKRMGAHIAKKMAEESPPPEPTPTQPR